MKTPKQLKLDALVQKAYNAVYEAQAYADEHKLSFSFELAYGMGGTYQGNPNAKWDEPGWNPLSQSC